MAISGRLVFLAAAGTVAVLLFPGSTAIWLWLLLLTAAVAADLLAAAPPGALLLARAEPAGVRLGETAEVELTITNTGPRMLRGSFRDGWQPSAGALNPVQRLQIPGRETRRFTVTLTPERRGELDSKTVAVRSFGPLGLAARQQTLPCPAKLRVLPPFHAKAHLPSKLRRLRELDGNASVQLRGAGTEFDSLRDYVRGDDVRSIDWRATARRRDTVVRTWRPERDRRVILALDTSRTSAARIGEEPRLDTGIEAALLLAMLAHGGADRVDFLAFDRRIRARVRSAGKGNLLHQLVTAMAPLEAELIEADFSLVPGAVQSVSAHRSLVVLITALDSGAIEEGLLPVLPQLLDKHVVVIASVRDPELEDLRRHRDTATEAFRAAAAERALLDRAAVTAQLRSMGAEVVDETPHELPPRLADLYLRLKATGRL
ncbi:DUF58 domain-containing protein [Arthrobacter sp. zg-ZUI100]|uniref:DUF58 domain-containing protein n=1 Tax=Arthrobacter jiangjiafuii TaxID=2817475 RepID=A0A975M4A7_9MICC|nr:DUF58 domain-containing protein [Arthrobacter jiangjiafuii]MBP3034831.1 DUF58 domain-containing protein [Arthrobacter jiangjiafuii]MBP3044589.1 DUF58 domain-containing protein [Arthrobacter jiangjiafuii]QWC09309.1 DUF58 domain-containing protein [Arthrobacter jiangjiafuii]